MDLREQIRIAIGGALAAHEGSDGAADAVMEVLAKQRPAAWCATDETGTVVEALGMNQSRRFDTALYLALGALEQARLNGMGSSREAALVAKLEALEKERDFAKTEIARLHDDIRELTDVRVLDEGDRGRVVAHLQGEAKAKLDSLEATEKDSARHKALAESALRVAKGWEDKCDELRAKIEAAERERDECNRRRLEAADNFAAQTALMKEQIEILRAKVEAMERQKPVAEWVDGAFDQYPHLRWREPYKAIVGAKLYTKLYALPGAQTQGEGK